MVNPFVPQSISDICQIVGVKYLNEKCQHGHEQHANIPYFNQGGLSLPNRNNKNLVKRCCGPQRPVKYL